MKPKTLKQLAHWLTAIQKDSRVGVLFSSFHSFHLSIQEIDWGGVGCCVKFLSA